MPFSGKENVDVLHNVLVASFVHLTRTEKEPMSIVQEIMQYLSTYHSGEVIDRKPHLKILQISR